MKSRFSTLKKELIETNKNGISLELRLIFFFLIFLITIMLGISLILVSTGVFDASMKENTALFEKELSHIYNKIYVDFSNISLSSISLAEQLSMSIENTLLENGISPDKLSQNPHLLNTILSKEYDNLLQGLKTTKSSGVFLILDATINPNIEGSEDSRAGLFLKNLEATAVNSVYYDIRYMRGPAAIGRSNGMTFLPQWKMEFDVKDADFFTVPMYTAEKSNLSLSRLYYWCPKTRFDNSDSAMLCSVPLIASDGTVMGVAGYEIRTMLFKLIYSPHSSIQNPIFCMLSPSDHTYLYMEKGMFAGNYSVSNAIPTTNMKVVSKENELNQYICANNNSYFGLDKKIQLYSTGSPYEEKEWSVVLLVPEADMNEYISEQNKTIILLLVLLTAICIILSVLISHKYLYPVIEAFDTIKMKKLSEHKKTKIPEIDDLIEYLEKQDDKAEKINVDSAAHNTTMFENFVENIKTLSFAEKAVFDLYLKEHTAQEIAKILCLSINTIKTHNKRIYMKLNVSSRKELLVYIQMMNELNEKTY